MWVERQKRPDGSERAPIKVKPGYVDPSLIQKYDANARHVGSFLNINQSLTHLIVPTETHWNSWHDS